MEEIVKFNTFWDDLLGAFVGLLCIGALVVCVFVFCFDVFIKIF